MAARPNSHCGPRYPRSGREGYNNLIEKKLVTVNMPNVKTKTQKVFSPCELDTLRDNAVGERALVAALPDSLCGLQYPVSGWEGRNNSMVKN